MARVLTGMVVSDKNDKTIIVAVETRKTHPIYKKQYTQTKRFAVHDEANLAKVGDRVDIVETKPISSTKKYKLDKLVAKAGIEHIEEEPEILEQPKKAKKESSEENAK